MMVRIFILKASVKKEACGKLYARAGGPEAYSRQEAVLPVFPESTPLARLRQQGNHKRDWRGKVRKESEHLDQRPLFLVPVLTKR